MSEAETTLLRRFVATGDPEAFSEIVQRHAGLVYGACLRVLRDQDKAADAVQETFVQLLRNAGNISASVPSWLHRVATRRAIDQLRRDSVRRQRERQYAVGQPREVNTWEDLSQYVDEELDALDDQTKEVLIRHFFEGQTTRVIGGRMGISQATVSRRVEAGVGRLRERLRKRGLILSAAVLCGLMAENAVQAAPAVVMKELGKMALVGGHAAAASTATAAAGAGGAAGGTAGKVAAAGVLTGAKLKVVTAAAVAAVGVGAVVVNNKLDNSGKQSPPPAPSSQQYSSESTGPIRAGESQYRRTGGTSSPVTVSGNEDITPWWESAGKDSQQAQQTPPTTAASAAQPQDQSGDAGLVGGGMGGFGMGATAPPRPSAGTATATRSQGGMGGMSFGYSAGPSRDRRPRDPNEEDQEDESSGGR